MYVPSGDMNLMGCTRIGEGCLDKRQGIVATMDRLYLRQVEYKVLGEQFAECIPVLGIQSVTVSGFYLANGYESLKCFNAAYETGDPFHIIGDQGLPL